MHNADRAVLRIGTGIGLAAGICYGLALPMPHLGVIMAWVVLCRPGEPLSLGKGLLGGALLLAVMVGGVLLVPLLTHYALAAVLLVALLLYLLMQQAMAGKGAAAPRARNYFSDADDSAFDALGEFSAFTPGRPAGNKGSGKPPRSGAAPAAKSKAGRPGPAGKAPSRPAAGKSPARPGAKPAAKPAAFQLGLEGGH